MELELTIERAIAANLAGDEPRVAWTKPAVRRYGFLPMYLGSTVVIGIRPDGSFVRWDHENAPEGVAPLDDAYWQRIAVCAAAGRHPELRALIPRRPRAAHDCEVCGGSGHAAGASSVMCQCGGLGWLAPGEPTSLTERS